MLRCGSPQLMASGGELGVEGSSARRWATGSLTMGMDNTNWAVYNSFILVGVTRVGRGIIRDWEVSVIREPDVIVA